jgi:hypothetical protein
MLDDPPLHFIQARMVTVKQRTCSRKRHRGGLTPQPDLLLPLLLLPLLLLICSHNLPTAAATSPMPFARSCR